MTILLALAVMAILAVVLGGILGFASVRFKVEGDPLVEKLMPYYRKPNVVNVAIRDAVLMPRQSPTVKMTSINVHPVERKASVSLPNCLGSSLSRLTRVPLSQNLNRLLSSMKTPLLAVPCAFKPVRWMLSLVRQNKCTPLLPVNAPAVNSVWPPVLCYRAARPAPAGPCRWPPAHRRG